MSARTEKLSREQGVLKLSIICTLLIAFFGIVMGIVTGSSSIIFDGMYSALDCFFSLAALMVTRLIQLDTAQTESRRSKFIGHFQFGFWHLEPLLLAINGLCLSFAVFYGSMNAIGGLVQERPIPAFDWGIAYAAIATIACLGLAFYERHVNKKIKSAFIAIDVQSWLISGGISLALLITFIAAILFERTALNWLIPYADPFILLVICILLAPMPIRTVIGAIRGVFLYAPKDIDRRVRKVANEIVEQYGFSDVKSYVAQIGRSLTVELHFIVPNDYAPVSVADFDHIRTQISDAIGQQGPDRWLTVSFTADEKWAI